MNLTGPFGRALLKRTVATAPVGQQAFTSAAGPASFASTSTNFVVPANVTEVCAVSIAAGQPATSFGGGEFRSGDGGDLRYLNAIPVTPGETLTIVGMNYGVFELRRGGTTLLAPGGGAGIGFSGGAFAQATNSDISGGGAGGYTSAGGAGGVGTNGGGGSSLLGGGAGATSGSAPSIDGGAFGGGAGVSAAGSVGLSGPRGLRIIWGPGRAFPNTNTGDV